MEESFSVTPSLSTTLVSFWNLRASGFDVVFLPNSGSEQLRRWVVSKLSTQDGGTTQFPPEVPVLGGTHSRADYEGHRDGVVSLFPELEQLAVATIGDVLDDPYVGGPAPHAGRRTILASVEERYGQVALVAHLPEPPFQGAELGDERSSQLLAWGLEPYGIDVEGGPLPCLSSVNLMSGTRGR
jgi:hypothetical protein